MYFKFKIASVGDVFSYFTGFIQVRENWKKSGNLSGQWKIFFGKVVEKSEKNETLVPPDVRFSG